MNREDIIKLAREASATGYCDELTGDAIERFAALVAAAEREACAKVCEEKESYAMTIPCPDGIQGCCVMHTVPATRMRTANECAAAIRARGETK